MEYIFMLNESKTLVDRISTQIENIINHEEQADSWLECLTIISLAGIHNNSVSINSLFQKVVCNQKLKMIKYFEKEYFIKVTQNSSYIECLHVLRARIIYNILMERGIFDKEKILINTLGVIEHNATQMLIEYAYETRVTEELVDHIANIKFLSIEVYADIVKALLWCEIYHYAQINRTVIEEGDALFNNQFMFLGNTDITGLLQIDLLHDICKVFNEVNPDFEEQMMRQLRKLPVMKLEYKFLDAFLIATCEKLGDQFQIREYDLTAWGYILFWMSYRNIYLTEVSVDNIDWNLNIERTLNYILGLSKQGWFSLRNNIVEVVMPSILRENGVIYYEITDNEVFVLINMLLGNEKEEPYSRIMKMVSIFQRLFPEKEKYNIKMVGYRLVEGITVPDTQKNISQEHLPYVWITQLNSWFGNMQKYNKLPENWKGTYDKIVDARNAILEYFQILLESVEKFYRNENVSAFSTYYYKQKKRIACELTTENPYIAPKCAVDKFGIRNNNYVVEDNHEKYSNEQNLGSDKKHISYLCRKYFSHTHAFCENAENILVDAKTKKQRDQKSRVAYYNLIQALMELDVFQQKFDDYFSTIGVFQNNKLETDLLEKMASVFTIIFFNNFAREKSICYRARESMRVTERKIVRFMENDIKALPGVKSIMGDVKSPIVEVDVFDYEKFLSQFYYSVKKLAKEVDNVSFPGYLLKKHFGDLNVNIICEENIFRSINIPVRNILINKEYDKFISTLIPNEEKGEIQIVNASQGLFQGISAINSLKIMFMYTAEIDQELLDKRENAIVKDVYFQYQEKVVNLTYDAEDILKKAVEYICSNAVTNISEMMDAKTVLEETVDQMRDVIFDVAKESSYEEILDFFERLTIEFCNYVDASGLVIAN